MRGRKKFVILGDIETLMAGNLSVENQKKIKH